MQKLTILNSREIKKIREMLLEDFDYYPEGDFALLSNETQRIFLVNRDIARLDLDHLKIDRIGLYLGEVRETQFRLSKEGAQYLMHKASQEGKPVKHTVELNAEEVKSYFEGKDLSKDLGMRNNLIILHHKGMVLGCSQYKEGKILNFLPKMHRGEVIV
ncbi:hypothetical protein HYV86_06475 [Candidatus Woesearchaeota archaeon]|nr:hypothetical protein [Candidatus Woesearchaeota archaeon]